MRNFKCESELAIGSFIEIGAEGGSGILIPADVGINVIFHIIGHRFAATAFFEQFAEGVEAFLQLGKFADYEDTVASANSMRGRVEIDCVGDLFIACIVNNCAYLGIDITLDIVTVVIVRIAILTLLTFGDAVKIYDWKNQLAKILESLE